MFWFGFHLMPVSKEMAVLRKTVVQQHIKWINSTEAPNGKSVVDISALCSAYETAFKMAGAHGTFTLLNNSAVYKEATRQLKHVQLPSFERSLFDYNAAPLGSIFWAHHWLGAFLSQKAKQDGMVDVLIQYLTTTWDPSYYYFHEYHAVAWTYLAPKIRMTREYPTTHALQWCGDDFFLPENSSSWTCDQARGCVHPFPTATCPPRSPCIYHAVLGGRWECAHGIGHAVFYAFAPSTAPCKPIRPTGWSMPKDLLNQALQICWKAPSSYLRYHCISGLFHSYWLYHGDRGPTQPILPFPTNLDQLWREALM